MMTAWLPVSSLQAQENLRDMVQGVGAGWMAGKWTGTNSQGRSVTVKYQWELEGHALEIDLQLGNNAYKGMITVQPNDGEIVEFGADNAGGSTRATWREEYGRIISERTDTRPDGRIIRVAVINKQLDADTLIATMQPLSSGGQIGEAILDTVTLKRATAADTEE